MCPHLNIRIPWIFHAPHTMVASCCLPSGQSQRLEALNVSRLLYRRSEAQGSKRLLRYIGAAVPQEMLPTAARHHSIFKEELPSFPGVTIDSAKTNLFQFLRNSSISESAGEMAATLSAQIFYKQTISYLTISNIQFQNILKSWCRKCWCCTHNISQ